MRKETNGKDQVVQLPYNHNLARGLRTYLGTAGVKRPELTTSDRTRKAITFYDLRATGITWMAIRGDDALKIMQRAGHSDFKTTQLYVREAEIHREGFGQVFPPLPSSLWEGDADAVQVLSGGDFLLRRCPRRRRPTVPRR
jgi:hypothetical protein